jgi:hypothetical protein
MISFHPEAAGIRSGQSRESSFALRQTVHGPYVQSRLPAAAEDRKPGIPGTKEKA